MAFNLKGTARALVRPAAPAEEPSFTLVGRRIGVDEGDDFNRRVVSATDDEGTAICREFLEGAVTDWEDVVDEDGQPVSYDPTVWGQLTRAELFACAIQYAMGGVPTLGKSKPSASTSTS